jgi:tetratricopeptide (TPR) repeat protein
VGLSRSGRALACGLWALALLARPVAADEPELGDAQRGERARAQFEIGRQHFRVGEYEAAIAAFEKGYQYEPRPLFLLNIGMAELRRDRCVEALAAFRRFLAEDPAAPERAQVEEESARLSTTCHPSASGALAAPAGASAAVASPAPRPAPAARDDRHAGRAKVIAGLMLGVAGVALVAAGAGLEAIARADNAVLDRPPAGWVFDQSLQDRRDRYHPLGVSLLCVGIAGAVTGVVLAVVGLHARARARAASAQ